MSRFWLVMVIGGGMLIYFGVQELRLAGVAKAEPQPITVAKLAAHGPGDNAHIRLGEFLLCEGAYVYEEESSGGTWSRVWIPAVPLGGPYHEKLLEAYQADPASVMDVPMPTDLNVIVELKVNNEEELIRIADQDELQGLVVNEIASLGGEERKILEQSYPGVDFDRCWIVEAGRLPAGAGKTYGFLGGGSALGLAGVGLLLVSRRKQAA